MKFSSPSSFLDSSASFPPHVVDSRSARVPGTNQETLAPNGCVSQSHPAYANVLHGSNSVVDESDSKESGWIKVGSRRGKIAGSTGPKIKVEDTDEARGDLESNAFYPLTEWEVVVRASEVVNDLVNRETKEVVAMVGKIVGVMDATSPVGTAISARASATMTDKRKKKIRPKKIAKNKTNKMKPKCIAPPGHRLCKVNKKYTQEASKSGTGMDYLTNALGHHVTPKLPRTMERARLLLTPTAYNQFIQDRKRGIQLPMHYYVHRQTIHRCCMARSLRTRSITQAHEAADPPTQSNPSHDTETDELDNFDGIDEGEIEFEHDDDNTKNIVDPTPPKNLRTIEETDDEERSDGGSDYEVEYARSQSETMRHDDENPRPEARLKDDDDYPDEDEFMESTLPYDIDRDMEIRRRVLLNSNLDKGPLFDTSCPDDRYDENIEALLRTYFTMYVHNVALDDLNIHSRMVVLRNLSEKTVSRCIKTMQKGTAAPAPLKTYNTRAKAKVTPGTSSPIKTRPKLSKFTVKPYPTSVSAPPPDPSTPPPRRPPTSPPSRVIQRSEMRLNRLDHRPLVLPDGDDDPSSSSSSSSSSSTSSDDDRSRVTDGNGPPDDNRRHPHRGNGVPSDSDLDDSSDDEEHVVDQAWERRRRDYVRGLIPTTTKKRVKAEKLASKLFDQLFKRASLQNISMLRYQVDQLQRSREYRRWLNNMLTIFRHNHHADKILTEDMDINHTAQVPWYVLKGVALLLVSKMTERMRFYIKGVDNSDPIAILQKLETICAGMNPAIRQQVMARLHQTRILPTESGTQFLARFNTLLDEAYTYQIRLSESERVDIVIEGLRHDREYQSYVNTFTATRAKERSRPNRHASDNLTVEDIELQINAHDRQQRVPHRQVQRKFPTARANQAQVTVKPDKKYQVRCFICNGNHPVKDHPGITKGEIDEAFKKAKEQGLFKPRQKKPFRHKGSKSKGPSVRHIHQAHSVEESPGHTVRWADRHDHQERANYCYRVPVSERIEVMQRKVSIESWQLATNILILEQRLQEPPFDKLAWNQHEFFDDFNDFGRDFIQDFFTRAEDLHHDSSLCSPFWDSWPSDIRPVIMPLDMSEKAFVFSETLRMYRGYDDYAPMHYSLRELMWHYGFSTADYEATVHLHFSHFRNRAHMAQQPIIHGESFTGIPPVHISGIGASSQEYWLPDSGATSHMTPFLSDIDPDSLRVHNASILVANNNEEVVTHRGNVTLVITDVNTGNVVHLTIYDVLVVPELAKRLLSTGALNKFDHEVVFRRHSTVFRLFEPATSHTPARTTVVKIPRWYCYDDATNTVKWPEYVLSSESTNQTDTGQIILATPAPVATTQNAVTTKNVSYTYSAVVSTGVDTPNSGITGYNEPLQRRSVQRGAKRSVGIQLLHQRLGHRSIESLLLAHNDDIWSDISVSREPETICTTCQMTLSRRTARNKNRPKTYPLKPGVMVMVDIINNPFLQGLTSSSHFRYYLLIVDVFSSFPTLLGLHRITTTNVLSLLLRYRGLFTPIDGNPAANEVNMHTLRHVRADAGSQFDSAEFKDACLEKGINVTLAAPKHQEQNGLAERTWQSIRNLAFSFMNYARVGLEFGDMALDHAWKVFSVLPIKDLHKDERTTTPYELFYGRKPSLRKFRVLFCPCVYKVYERSQAQRDGKIKRFNSKNHPQRGTIGIFVGFPRGQAGYLIWEPRSRTIRVSADVTFDETFSSYGPRRHFAFDDAIPVVSQDDTLDYSLFRTTDPTDDHYGIPLLSYQEDDPTDGFLITMRNSPGDELFIDDDSQIDDTPVVEEPRVEEENDVSDCDIEDIAPSLLDPTVPDTANPHDDPNHDRPTTSDDDTSIYKDALTIATTKSADPQRRSARHSRKPSRYLDDDTTDFARYVDAAFRERHKLRTIHSVVHSAFVTGIKTENTIEGSSPENYLPEPQSLKSIDRLPSAIREAWLAAYRSEIMNLLKKETFKHPTHYQGEKCLPVRAVMKTKLRSDGMVDKLKVRIAIRGDLDMDAQDEDNSAPLASFRLLKVFLAEAARRKCRVYQADFVGAYLQALMDRIVYVKLPAEYATYFPELAEWFGVPLLLHKSAYGINSAGRLWAEELFGWYIEFGFKQSTVDPSLFTYENDGEWIILLSYCDDSAYFASSTKIREQFEKAMCSKFDCKLLGQLHWFLQARITQHENFNITLDQSRYAASMCTRFLPRDNVTNPSQKDLAKYASPLPHEMVFTKVDCSKDFFEVRKLQDEFGFEYPVVVGCLLWILNTFSRLQFAIRKLAKFMRLPGRAHFRAMLHLLHHVRCYHMNGLTYYHDIMDAPVARLLFTHGIDPTVECLVFSDSSWQDDPDSGRSTGGYHIFCQGGIIDSASMLPEPVAMSSAEAEYNTASAAGMAASAMAMLIQDIRGNDPDEPIRIPILIDNKACISMGESFRDTKHTRHIMRRVHYLRWMVEHDRAVLVWIPGEIQLADPATKNVNASGPTYVLLVAMGETRVQL